MYEWQRGMAVSLGKIGDIQVAQGDQAAARTSYQESHAIFERLAEANPDNSERLRDLSISHNAVGDFLQQQGDVPAALLSYRASLAIAARLVSADPDNALWQRDLSLSHINIGDMQKAQGDLQAALASYQAALAIRERLAQDDPGNSVWQRDLFICHQRIGNVQLARGDARAALAGYRTSLEIALRLAEADPGNADWQEDLSASYVKAGDILLAYGDLATALTSYQASLAIRQRLAQADPGNAQLAAKADLQLCEGERSVWRQDVRGTCAGRCPRHATARHAGAARRLDDRRVEAARTPMSEVFVSYKREDEARVGRLVQALENAGLSVWWDRGLAGGESWRTQIQTALDAAKCVIVVWTRESVGPAGDFVRDEAGQAKRRGVLVPVLLDKVDPPLGFGEIQAIDLTRWKGNPRDPFFQDLRAAVAAKLEGRAVPPAKGPMKRLVRRLTLSSVASVIGLGLGVRVQPVQRTRPRCAGSRCSSRRFRTCAVRSESATGHRRRSGLHGRAGSAAVVLPCALMSSAFRKGPTAPMPPTCSPPGASLRRRTGRQVRADSPCTWVRMRLPPAIDAAAQAAALARGQVAAERLCKSFAATTSFRFTSANAGRADLELLAGRERCDVWLRRRSCVRSGGAARAGIRGVRWMT